MLEFEYIFSGKVLHEAEINLNIKREYKKETVEFTNFLTSINWDVKFHRLNEDHVITGSVKSAVRESGGG